MPRIAHLLPFFLVVLAGCSCNDRTVGDDEPEPDIEGLCQTHCERVFECGTPASTVSSVEECIQRCEGAQQWHDPNCAGAYEEMYVCFVRRECPEFTNDTICNDDTRPDHECCPELLASQLCT